MNFCTQIQLYDIKKTEYQGHWVKVKPAKRTFLCTIRLLNKIF